MRKAGRRKNLAAHVAFRREHQGLGSQSGMTFLYHSRENPQIISHAPAWRRRRSVSSLITAAAVSSIERRVTSIVGQLCLAQSRRENATSSATALLSIY